MNVLILANHYLVCSARYTFDALQRLGCDVRTTGPSMGRHIWGLDLPDRYAWNPTPPEPGWTPDLILVMDSDPAILDSVPEIIANLSPENRDWIFAESSRREPYSPSPFTGRGLGGGVAVFAVDNHVRDYRRPWFNHYFLAHRSVTIQPYTDQTTWLPCAYDPIHFTPSPIPFDRREYDVAIVGVMYPQRLALINALRQVGLKVFAATGLVYDGYAAAYHNARVSLCVSARGDVAQRIFETAALGCVVVSDDCPDLAALDADPILTYRTLDEAVQQCIAAQTQPERAIAAQQWAQPHTWDARAAHILENIERKDAKTRRRKEKT